MRLPVLAALASVLATPALVPAQTSGIEHEPVACLVAGKFPRLSACVPEPDGVGNARAYFRAEGTETWYHVVMSREAACFAAALPKPKRDLLGKRVEYYLEADHRRLGSPRTPEYRPVVVADEKSCTGFVARLAKAAPKAVFPALPAGFAASGAGIGTAAIVGAGAAAAGGAAAAVGAAGGGDEGTTSTTVPMVIDPTTTTVRPTVTTQPGGPGTLAIECSATPDNGALPLTVHFDAGAVGVSVAPSFVWDFGDGTGGTGSPVDHVYRTAGRFTATVTGTAGALTGSCTRAVAATVGTVAMGTLNVRTGGTGGGRVVSAPAGIDCGTTCSASFPQGSDVELRPEAKSGSKFEGWKGACSGAGACVVKMNGNPLVEAAFELVVTGTPQTFLLTVGRSGSNPGTVRSSPAGIDCGGDCDERYASGTRVSLDASSVSVDNFQGWSGDCSGTGTCQLVMTQDRAVTARFSSPPAMVALTVVPTGSGKGTVTGAGISCPDTCSANQTQGSTVTLRAQPGANAVFSGWSGDCGGQSDSCTLTMDAARTVRARFDAVYRLDVTLQGQGRVRSDSQINCPGTCSETQVDGTVVNLVATPVLGGGGFQSWDGDCASQGAEQTCAVTLNRNRAVGARFGGVIPIARPEARWRSTLAAAGARGVVSSGTRSVSTGAGERLVDLPGADETIVTAVVEGGRAGTWRFEAQEPDALEPGSLRVLSGEALSVGPSSVAFRVGPGTRVVFAYRARALP